MSSFLKQFDDNQIFATKGRYNSEIIYIYLQAKREKTKKPERGGNNETGPYIEKGGTP